MHIITTLAQKGGCGKSTISVNLAFALAALHPHLKVAVGDADKQGSATAWIKRSNGAAGVTVHQVAEDGEGKNFKAEMEALKAQGISIVILDLPPALESIALRSAIRADLILIPALPSIVDLAATGGAVNIAKEAIELAPGKQFLLVPNRVQFNTSVGRELRGALEKFGPVSEVTLCQRVAYSEAAGFGLGVTQCWPESPAAQEIGLLAEEVSILLSIK